MIEFIYVLTGFGVFIGLEMQKEKVKVCLFWRLGFAAFWPALMGVIIVSKFDDGGKL